MLDGVDVLHLWNVRPSVELLLTSVPLVDNRPLRAARQNKVGFARDFQILHVSVTVPWMERLVRVEAVAVPLVHRGGASLRAVCYHKEELAVHAEHLNVVGFSDFQDVDVLDFDEFVSRGVHFVDMRATKKLGDYDEEVVIDDHWLAHYRGSACNDNHRNIIKNQFSQSVFALNVPF